MENTTAIILAAGEGNRMDSCIPKVLCNVLEIPMIDWILDALDEANIKDKCVVVGYKAQEVVEHIGKRAVFAFQKERKGTAEGVKAAIDFLEKNKEKDVFICCGDSPLLDVDTITKSYFLHKNTNCCATVISAKVLCPKDLGRIVRDENGNILKIVEKKDANIEELKIDEVNSGAYWFCVKDLLAILGDIESKNKQNEYYLTDSIDILIKNKKKVSCFVAENSDIIFGVNDRFDLLKVNGIIKENIIKRLIKKGVEFISTDGVLISKYVEIGKNTKIFPGTIILGNTKIGENSIIGPNTLIENSVVGNNCKINASQVRNSRILDFTTIGPFSNIRPDSEISHHVKIGDFVEVKNSAIGAGTAISHLTYVGDSDVGKNVNFGCGVVTINYDGVKKNRCKISDGSFIGCNTNLVAPVKLGKNSYTGAGSTITKDVPDEALAIERGKQVHVKDFSKYKLKGRKLKVKY